MEATPDPTPVEIREQCRQIQATWTERTERTRGLWAYGGEAIEFPRVQAVELLEAGENRH